MVAIVAGKGLGLLNTSLNTVGAAGVLGQSALGHGVYRAIINVVNGNLVLQTQDAQLAGRGTDLFALRTYNSLGTPSYGDEDNWHWEDEPMVKFEGTGTPHQPEAGDTSVRTDGDGHETPYIWDPARAAFVGTDGRNPHDELRYDSVAREWVWVDSLTRVTERYADPTGSSLTERLVRRRDTSNNSLVFSYDGGRLTRIQDESSEQELRLSYGPINGVTRMLGLEARSLIDDVNGHPTTGLGDPILLAKYDYDNYGELKSATRYLAPANSNAPAGAGFITTFGFNDSWSRRIASLTQSDGTSVSFTYDPAGRVKTVKDPGEAGAVRLVFDYDLERKSTAITDGEGQIWTCQYDGETGRLTNVITPPIGGTEQSTSFRYDNRGNLAGITDPNTNALTFEYDDRGNRTLERDASGNTTTRTFSEFNQMLTETHYRVPDPDGEGPQGAADPITARYVYDTNARLRFIVSAEGRVSENRYSDANAGPGLLTQTLLYSGELFDVNALEPTQPLTETELIDWIAGLPAMTQVQLTEYSYDLRGNLSQQTRFATVSVVGAGILDSQASVMEYIYDAYSQLRQQIAVRGNARDQRTVVASFAYDGMRRVVNRNGVNGPETTVYDDTNLRVTTTMASGLTDTREYDNRGRLVSVTQAGDGTTRPIRYIYDNADRLRMVEDAQKSRRYRFYDAAGRIEFQVDATGAVIRFEYDGAGQLVRQTQYLNRVDTSNWYDDATQTVTKAGLTVGGAGSDVVVDGTHDRVTIFDYDKAGRLTKTTDALNRVKTVAYDGFSRVVMTQTGDRAIRYLYDKDSHQVGMVDALGYLTEYKYDAAGRLIGTVRYSQRSPAAANITGPVWIGVTDQMLEGGRPFERRVPAYDADGDAITFSLAGEAPVWLTFDTSTATLRGVPPAAEGNYSITLRADDGRGKQSDVTLQLNVISAVSGTGLQDAGPAWTSLSPLDLVANTSVNYVVSAAEGLSLTYSVIGGMPPGLSFDAVTRTISGDSSAVGFYSILLRAQDASGKATERTLSVRIHEATTAGKQSVGSDQLSAWRPADTTALHSYTYYDGQGRVVGAVDEQGFLTETVYDDALNTQRVLRYLSTVTVSSGDSLASLRGRAGATRQISLVQYDDFGRVLEVTELDGSTITRRDYDLAGRLTRVVSAAGTDEERSRRVFYNAFGEVTATLEGEGNASLGTNPSPQQLQDAIRDFGTRYEYDTLGRMVRSIDANGNLTLFYYDSENRRTHTISVIGQSADNSLAGEVSETKYDTFGQAVSTRGYASRIANADMSQLLADGGGGLAGQSLLDMLVVLADASVDELIQFEYDRSGRLTKQIDGENGFVENIYNIYGEVAGQVRSIREGRTTTIQYDYDLNGRIVSQTADVGAINSNMGKNYDAFGRVIRSVDGTGRAITTAYEQNGRTILVTDGLLHTMRTEYEALGRVSRQTNAFGQETRYTYDDIARRATETTPEGRKRTIAYTRHGEIESTTDGRGNIARFEFNRDGQPTTVTDALGKLIARTTYDKSGRLFETTDGRGALTRFDYDQRNRLREQRVDPAGLNLTTLIDFNALGRQIRLTEGAGSPSSRVTTYGYDRKGRLTTVVVDVAAGGLQLCMTNHYDGLDNPSAVSDGTVANPNQHVILYEYDNLGRRVKEIVAPASIFGPGAPGTRDITTQERYDAAGRLTRKIDANGGSSWYVYDAAGQLTLSISALGDVTESQYDPAGRLVFSRSYYRRLPAAKVAAFGDFAELVTLAPTLDDRRSRVAYDGDGEARFRLNAVGSIWAVSESLYDASGNVVENRNYDRFMPDTQVVALESTGSPGITVQEIQNELRTMGYREEDLTTLAGVQRTYFAYDANNRLRFTVDPLGSIMESVYDPTGNLIAKVNFAIRPTLTEHSEAAINTAVNSDDPDNRVTRYAYDAASRLRFMVDTLGSVSENEYDVLGNIITTKRWATRPALTAFTETAIMAALADTPVTKNDEITHLVYDAGNRLRFTIDPTNSVSENRYDALGNIVMTIHFARRLAPAPAVFTEDEVSTALGPLQNRPDNQVTHFAYDASQRLRFAIDPLGSITERAYDANGNLLVTMRFVVRPALAQFDEATIAAAVAPIQSNPGNRLQRFAYDALDRLRYNIDALGSITERIYDALGNLTGTVDFVVRPPLAQITESAINEAVAPERGNPGNRLEYQLFDALGRVRISVLRVSVENGQSKYQVTEHKLNALGQLISSTSYATTVVLNSVSRQEIRAAVGAGDPARDKVSHFVYNLAGQLVYMLQAVTVEATGIKYRVKAQRFDTFGQLIGSTDYAMPLSTDAFNEARLNIAVKGIADKTRDHVSVVAYDGLGQAVYNVQVLSPDLYQVTKRDYNPLGRMFRMTQYSRAVGVLAAFDRTTIESAVVTAVTEDRVVQYIYDAVGRQRFLLQADKSGNWTVGENRYDTFGNLVESRRYDRYITDAKIATLGLAHPAGVSEKDVIAQLASLGYSDSKPATLARIQRSRFAYDRQNRLRFTTDALGSVVEKIYNAVGDLTTTMWFAVRPELANNTERGINAAVDRENPDNRVQHFAYDAVGRIRFNVRVIKPNAGPTSEHWVNEQRYDALGRLIETVAYAIAVGHLASYDELTLAESVIADPVNDRHTVIVYDAGGRQVFTLRALRIGPDDRYVVTQQVYDALSQMMQRVDYATPLALTQLNAVAVESAVIVTPDDRMTTYVRDAAGRLRFEIRPDMSLRESLYDALDQVVETRLFNDFRLDHAPWTEAEMSAARGDRAVGDGITRGQTHSYDAMGRLTRTVDALGNAEQYKYDALGNRTRWIDKNDHISTCVYDRRGRKTIETTPPLQFKVRGEDLTTPPPNRVLRTRFAYDAFGNTIRKIEAANFPSDASTTDFEFDTVGRPTRTFYDGFYDAATGTVEVKPTADRFRLEAWIVYDSIGNTVRTSTRTAVDAFQHTWRTYDSQGQVIHEINALNHVTQYTYNTFGEQETVTRYSVTLQGAPQNGLYWSAEEVDPQISNDVDEGGNVLARTIRLAYDTLGRKTAVTLPTATFYSTHMPGDAGQANYFRPTPPSVTGVQDSEVTRYEYNAFGDVILQRVRANTIVEWQETSVTYDTMGRRVHVVNAAGQITILEYNEAGNLVKQTEPSDPGFSRITTFFYNALDQQTRVDRYGLWYTDASGVEHGAVVWTWENGGEWLDPDADVATIVRTATYDGYDRRLVVTDAVGNATTMRYNALGQLTKVIGPASVVAPLDANGENAVDPFRNQVSERLVTTMTLDAFGRIVRQVRATEQGGDPRETLQSYDAAGNLVSTTDSEGHVKLRAYDYAGRLIRETQAIHSDLGPLGINEQGLERQYFYDAIGQLTETLDVYVDDPDFVQSGHSVLHNPFPNLMQSGKSLVYNAFSEVEYELRKWGQFFNPLIQTATVTQYTYDNAGHVVKKRAADGLTLYFYNLLGQVTREEKRGNSYSADGTGYRVTEYQYDVLGRVIMVRKPEFDADVTEGADPRIQSVTPYSKRALDRWGNVVSTEEGGYEFANGQPNFAFWRIFRSYLYDDNNSVIREYTGTHQFVSATGDSASAQINKLTYRDLLGNVVQEVDEARDDRDIYQTEPLLNSRTRFKEYDNIGRLTAEIDASYLRVRVEYAYNVHGERLGTRNARGTVLFDRYDRNGNILFHGVLRTTREGEYDSRAGTDTPKRIYLAAYLYDQANRRFAHKTYFSDNVYFYAPWSYTWLDGRNLGVKQCDGTGVITKYGFDPFGNKKLEIAGGGALSKWEASTADFVVGRIETYETYEQLGDNVPRKRQYFYNDFGELKSLRFDNDPAPDTSYDRHRNGLVSQINQENMGLRTTYDYDPRGQLTLETRYLKASVLLGWPDSVQNKRIIYDNQGRLLRIEQDAILNSAPCDVRYDYDEWNNVRHIHASSMIYKPGENIPIVSDGWYDYDKAGRITVSNADLVRDERTNRIVFRLKALTPGSVIITYDNVGRRARTTALEYYKNAVGGGSKPTHVKTWDTMRDERYEYNDLGHLRLIQQQIRFINVVDEDDEDPREGKPQPNREPDDWQPLSTRWTNLHGDLELEIKWTRISVARNRLNYVNAKHLSNTETRYLVDGRPYDTYTIMFNALNDTDTASTDAYSKYYDEDNKKTGFKKTGLLKYYSFSPVLKNGNNPSTNFLYTYTFRNGAWVVDHITSDRGNADEHDDLHTDKTYDKLGRLDFEGVDLLLENTDGSSLQRREFRHFFYSADNRIISKRTSRDDMDSWQTYVYAGNRIVATIGTDSLQGMTNFNFVYTPMSEAAASGGSRYIVQDGDSLISIAQTNYGDAALWYLIAEANGITSPPGDLLPHTEVGKAYEVPDAVRSSQNANTFVPYGPVEIIGNDQPFTIRLPPPKPSLFDQIVVIGTSIIIQTVVTAGLSALGVPLPLSAAIAGGLSNLGGQFVAEEMGMRSSIDWGSVWLSVNEGFVLAPLSELNQSAWQIGGAALIREGFQQAKSGFSGWTSGDASQIARGIGGSLFNIGSSTLDFKLGGLLNSMFNPRSGWAFPGSGRSPEIGAFEYAFGEVARGFAMMEYDWIKEQVKQPSAPDKTASAPARRDGWIAQADTKRPGTATSEPELSDASMLDSIELDRIEDIKKALDSGSLIIADNGGELYFVLVTDYGKKLLGPVDKSMADLLNITGGSRSNEKAIPKAEKGKVDEQKWNLERFLAGMNMYSQSGGTPPPVPQPLIFNPPTRGNSANADKFNSSLGDIYDPLRNIFTSANPITEGAIWNPKIFGDLSKAKQLAINSRRGFALEWFAGNNLGKTFAKADKVTSDAVVQIKSISSSSTSYVQRVTRSATRDAAAAIAKNAATDARFVNRAPQAKILFRTGTSSELIDAAENALSGARRVPSDALPPKVVVGLPGRLGTGLRWGGRAGGVLSFYSLGQDIKNRDYMGIVGSGSGSLSFALGEIGSILGLTALATAAAVLAAFGIGWEIGRFIDKHTGLSSDLADRARSWEQRLRNAGFGETASKALGSVGTIPILSFQVKNAVWAYDQLSDLIGYEIDLN